jgi:hypothetical protein
MPIDSTRRWLTSHDSFQRLIEEVVRSGILKEFPSIVSQATAEHDWPYLLLCASVLARSELGEEQRIALRIADTCLTLPDTSDEEKAAAAVVLDTMANRRSVALAAERQLVPAHLEALLPLPLRGDFLKRTSEDRIATSHGNLISANRFQTTFWRALRENDWVSASAPTSAGKSFLLRLWVAEVFRADKSAYVAFLVPTRALIQEFWDAFGDDLAAGLLRNVTLHTLPLEEDFAPENGHLFIFTQERLHILLGRQPTLAFQLLIVDEAQKVGDGYRGILLEQVINECVRRSSKTQIAYAAPFVDNPSYLIRGAPALVTTRAIERQVTTVTQNLLFASQRRGDPRTWNVSYVDGDHEFQLALLSCRLEQHQNQNG